MTSCVKFKSALFLVSVLPVWNQYSMHLCVKLSVSWSLQYPLQNNIAWQNKPLSSFCSLSHANMDKSQFSVDSLTILVTAEMNVRAIPFKSVVSNSTAILQFYFSWGTYFSALSHFVHSSSVTPSFAYVMSKPNCLTKMSL